MEYSYENIKSKKRWNIITALFIMMPILNVYGTGISGLGIGDILCVPLMIYILCFSRKRKNYGMSNTLVLLLLYYSYALIISFMNLLFNDYSMRDIFVRLLVDLFYIVIITIFTSKKVIDADYAYKFYLRISLIISCIVFIQVIMFYLFSRNVYFLIPFLRYNQSTLADYEAYVSAYNYMYLYQFRPTGIFLEPSHLALYIFPCAFFILNKNNIQKKDFLYALLITLAVLFSTSGVGYLLIFIVWLSYLFRILKKNRIQPWMFLFIVIMAITVIIFVINSDYSPVIIARLQSIGNGAESSINLRLLKGFYFAQNLNPLEQFFGIGCGAYDSYVNTHSFLGEEFRYEYMNSISEILVSTGIVGFVIFTLFLISLRQYLKKANYKLMFCLIVLMYLTGSLIFSWFDSFPIVMAVSITESVAAKSKKNYTMCSNPEITL